MIPYIALGLSIFNFLWIMVFNLAMIKLYRKLKPMLKSLTPMPIYAKMSTPPIVEGDNSETK